MRFEIYGPYDVPRNGRWVSRSRHDKRQFWEAVEEDVACLSAACGCYVFAIRGRAWYVGLAERRSFLDECFSGHKVLQYNEALQSVNGNPSLYFIPKITPRSRFARPSVNGHRDIRFLGEHVNWYCASQKSTAAEYSWNETVARNECSRRTEHTPRSSPMGPFRM
jgi:hypothetical protein